MAATRLPSEVPTAAPLNIAPAHASLATSKEFSELSFADGLDAQGAGFVQFASGVLTDHHVVVLLVTDEEALPPRAWMASSASRRVRLCREPVTTKVRPPRSGPAGTSRRSASMLTPACFSLSMTVRFRGLRKKATMLRAMMGPIPPTSSSSSSPTSASACRESNRSARSPAAVAPTWGMARAATIRPIRTLTPTCQRQMPQLWDVGTRRNPTLSAVRIIARLPAFVPQEAARPHFRIYAVARETTAFP